MESHEELSSRTFCRKLNSTTTMKYLLIIIATMVTAGIILLLNEDDPSSKLNGELTIKPDLFDETTVVFRWTGVIDPPLAREINQEFNRIKNDYKRISIELDSPGGSVDEGGRIIGVIQKMRKTHRISTYVGPENECLSMCVPIYMQGQLRVAATSSTWMFHEPIAVDVFSGNETFIYDFEQRQSTQSVFYEFFKNSEIDPIWREVLRHQMRLGEVWKSGRELKDERTNIIMVLE